MQPFIYRAQCVRVVDGDTVDLYVDCGFYQYAKLRFRLIGIDTPELNSKDQGERLKALEAKQFTVDMLKPAPVSDNWSLLVKTYKSDSFGRWLCDIYADGVQLNAELLSKSLAVPFKP
jgi:micrococcal nuclease